MTGETNLQQLLKTMKPKLQPGEYVFCSVASPGNIDQQQIICVFKEDEGVTLIVEKSFADKLQLRYSYVAAWITLTVHSSLEATGLTASFATALAAAGISCNVVAAFYHDHIFVNKKDAEQAMQVLTVLSGL